MKVLIKDDTSVEVKDHEDNKGGQSSIAHVKVLVDDNTQVALKDHEDDKRDNSDDAHATVLIGGKTNVPSKAYKVFESDRFKESRPDGTSKAAKGKIRIKILLYS